MKLYRDDKVCQEALGNLENCARTGEGNLLEFEIVDGDSTRPALEFLKDERLRLKSIERETKVDASEKNAETSSNDSPKTPALHTRSRSQKSLFDFGEDAADPWSPILDGRDITSVIMKNAMFKFFITANVKTRAFRRFKELKLLKKKNKF